MSRNLSIWFLVIAVGCVFPNAAVHTQTRAELDEEQLAARIEKVRKGVNKLGTGPDAFIKVKVWEKSRKIKGYVESAGEDEFTIVEKSSGRERTLRYSEVRHVSGKNMAFGTKVLIVVGSVYAATMIALRIIMRDS